MDAGTDLGAFDRGHALPEPAGQEGAGDAGDAGDAACWANLVCPECGSIVSEGHRDGCSLSAEQ